MKSLATAYKKLYVTLRDDDDEVYYYCPFCKKYTENVF